MARTKHGVVERQLLNGEWVGTKRVAIKFDKDLDNGSVVTLAGLDDDPSYNSMTPVYKIADVEATTTLDKVFLVASPEVMADERLKNLSDFYNEAGTIGNADALDTTGLLYVGLTAECFDGTPKVGSVVELQAGRKLKAVDSATGSGTTVFGKIVDFYNGKYGVRIGVSE